MNLRPYQQQAIDAALAAKGRGVNRCLITMPTGVGKTLMAANLAQQFRGTGPVLFIAHRDELLQQTAKTFWGVDRNLRIGVEKGTSRAYGGCDVVLASVQSIGRKNSTRLAWCRPRVVFADEAHRALAATWLNCFQRFGCFRPDGPLLVGLTATPKRLDRLNLQIVFQEHVYDYPLKQAIRDGYLVNVRGFRVKTTIDLDDISVNAGDFAESELAKRVNVFARNEAAYRYWADVARERPTVAFCASVDHARDVERVYRQHGVRAETVWGAMPVFERRAALRRFAAGTTQVLANCDLLTEGYDHPALSCIVMLRPTQSWTRYVQAAGRALRLHPGKPDAIILDVVDNCKKHDLATVPALLDLPPDLDLEGHTLLEAADALEAQAEAGKAQREEPKKFSDLVTEMEEVNLLDSPAVDGTPHSRLAWVRLVDGGYYLSCGGAKAFRSARLSQDALGIWLLHLYEGKEQVQMVRLGVEPKQVFNGADDVVLATWPESERLSLTKARWREVRPTPKQVALLTRLGVDQGVIARLESAGQASDLIDAHFAHQRRKRD